MAQPWLSTKATDFCKRLACRGLEVCAAVLCVFSSKRPTRGSGYSVKGSQNHHRSPELIGGLR